MDNTKRNALTELGNRLAEISYKTKIPEDGKYVDLARRIIAELAEDLGNIDEGPAPESICKARRIIAELAKVEDAEDFLLEQYDAETARRIVRQVNGNTILKCRAIAQEGGADGNR